jgi:hypothetical protein
VQELAKDNCQIKSKIIVYILLEDLSYGEKFNFMVRKISHRVNDKYQAMNGMANPILFKFKNENENVTI